MKEKRINSLATGFCKKYLDSEYEDLCTKLVRRLGKLEDVPFLIGTEENWASAVIHCLGTINLLWDDSFLPYISQKKIYKYFNSDKIATIDKSRRIQNLLGLNIFDDEFSTQMMAESNPLNEIKFSTQGVKEEKNQVGDESLQELIEMYFKEPLINRCGITVMPLKPFIDWVKYVTPEFKVPAEKRNLGNTYLADMINVEDDYERVLNDVYSRVFENELRTITTDESLWPQTRTMEVFKEWFVFKIDPMVFDLGEEEPLDEIEIDPFALNEEWEDFDEEEEEDDDDNIFPPF